MSQFPSPSEIVHGGRLIAARLRFPHAPPPFLDLSTGINPHAYEVAEWPISCFNRLPEPEEEQSLIEAAARAYGVVDPQMIVAAPGSQALISLLPRLFPSARVGVLVPTYSEHLTAWGRAAEAVESVAALKSYEIGVVCNPNNPDGRVVPADILLPLAADMATRGGLLVVDEAFADFVPGSSLARWLPRPGLMLMRSFGKAYGLAGLRLGFALTDAVRAERLRQALGPWAVSGPAIWAGRLALNDVVWMTQAARRCQDDAARLDRLLVDAGLEVIGGTPLFRLARHANARGLYEHLGATGLLARTFAAQPTWLRFGLPGSENCWTRLAAALASFG